MGGSTHGLGGRDTRRRAAVLAALLLSGLSTAAGIRFGVYSANYADASGYVAAARSWATGDLVRPAPLQLWASWPHAAETGAPLGFRPGPILGTNVPLYPAGLSWLMAAAERVGGDYGPFVIAPALGGVLVFVTFLLGRRAGGSAAGLIGAALVATSPIVLLHTVQPMSDVPATACWACAWYLGLRRGVGAALAAGAIVALAVAIRPNLAPLAIVPLALILTGGELRVRRIRYWLGAAAFVAAAACGPMLVAWTQLALYGSPFHSGYPGAESFFDAANVPANARNYWNMWVDVYGLAPLLGLAARLLPAQRGGGCQPVSRAVVVSAWVIVALNIGLYLAFIPYDHWPFLRFLLPASVAVFVLFGTALASLASLMWSTPRTRIGVLLLALAVAATAVRRPDLARYSLQEWRAHQVIPAMGKYLAETLPRNAVVLSFAHSGAIAHYSGADVVRLDIIEPATLDRIVEDLQKGGLEPVLVLDGFLERPRFADRFADSKWRRLDWPARAVATSVSDITYWVVSDRTRHLSGERWPLDHLRPGS